MEYKERYDKPEPKGSKYAKTFQKLTGHLPPTWEEKFEGRQKRSLTRKLARLRRLQSGPIKPKENGLRKKIRHLKRFYKSVGDHIIYPSWPDADEKRELIQNIWNEDLVEQFLNLNPRPTIIELGNLIDPTYFEVYPGPGWRRWAGLVPDPEKPGWVKHDPKTYVGLLISETEKRKNMMRDVIICHGLTPIESSPQAAKARSRSS